MKFLCGLFLAVLFFSVTQETSAQRVVNAKLDVKAKRVWYFNTLHPRKLAHALTRNCSSDKEKADAIYLWMTRHIKYDVKRFASFDMKYRSPRQTLRKRKGICADYSALYDDLCFHAGLNSATITGYVKGITYLHDDSLYNTEHAWNVLSLDGGWQLLDVTWASGYLSARSGLSDWMKHIFLFQPRYRSKTVFKRMRNDDYYLSDPRRFVINHLPSEPMYQLLEQPVPLDVFEQPARVINAYLDHAAGSRNFNADITRFFKTDSLGQHLWTGDSAYSFNNRNALQACEEYLNAGFMQVRRSGLDGQHELEEVDTTELKKSIFYFDSAKAVLPYARVMTAEEAFKRHQKNLLRKSLANADISDISRKNSYFRAQANNLRKTGKVKARALEKQNRNIGKVIRDLRKNARFEKMERRKIHPDSARIIISRNNLQVAANMGSLHLLSDTLRQLLSDISINFVDSLKLVTGITIKLGKKLEAHTEGMFWGRVFGADNRDSGFIPYIQKRQAMMDSALFYWHTRQGNLSGLRDKNDRIRQLLREIKAINRMNKRLLKDNYRYGAGDSVQKLYNASLDRLTGALKEVQEKNSMLAAFYKWDREQAKDMETACREHQKWLGRERHAEARRYESRDNYIYGRRSELNKFASSLGKRATAGIRQCEKVLKKRRKVSSTL